MVRLEDQTTDEVQRGYLQIFGGDMWVMVTDRWDFGPWAARIVTILHIVALPILVRAGWRAFARSSAETVAEARESPYVGWVKGLDDIDDRRRVGHVERVWRRVTACLGDLGREFVESFDASAGDHDMRACVGQHLGEASTQPRRGAGDEGVLSGQVMVDVRKWIVSHW